ARDKTEWEDDGGAANLPVGIDERRRRVRDRDAAGHQAIQDSLAHHALRLGQLSSIIDAKDLVAVLDGQRVYLAFDQSHDVRQVILAGPVLVLELEQRRPELAAV